MSEINVLHLEDSPLDAELACSLLRRSGLACRIERVEDRAGYLAALASGPFELILADYHLPGFDGLSALDLARELCPETPFIFVSGVLGEEVAIESLKRGATDYVVKQRLDRLGPAVARALAEARERTERRAVEATLRENQARLRVALKNSPLTVYNCDRDLRYTWIANPRGLPAEACLGRREDELRPAEETAELLAFQAEVLGSGEGGRREVALGAAAARECFDVTAEPLRDEEGRVVGLTVAMMDVTERKRAEAELRESGERLRQLADAMPQMVWACAPDGACDYWNSPAPTYFGLPYGELLGRGWEAVVHPDDRPETLVRWEEALRTGRPFEMEYRLRRADGAYRWHLARGQAVSSARGDVERWFGTCTDIDEQKQNAQERARLLAQERERSEQLRSLADTSVTINSALSHDAVLEVAAERARAIVGAHQAGVVLVPDGDWGRATDVCSYSEAYASWRGRQCEPGRRRLAARTLGAGSALRLLEAETRALEAGQAADAPPLRGWLGAPLTGGQGQPLGVIHLTDKLEGEFTENDLSLLVQLAQVVSVALVNARLVSRLRDADRRKDEFLAMLAHELRNPLAAISNAVQVSVLSRLQEQIDWGLEVVNRQVHHLTRLMDDLLDVSRITWGKVQLRKEDVDAYRVVSSAIEAVHPLIEERRHELNLSLRDGLRVEADPTRLEQILVNLLSNAAKYTESGGKIWLGARHEGDEVVFSVRDNGVGIPPEKLPGMFDLFTQGDRSLARSEGGLGIGLTLVRSLAELHGGSVDARSEGAGRGSEFIVRLPASRTAAEEGPKSPAQTPATGQSERILVVDDNVDSARGMARLLTLLGHDVRTMHDGPSAVEAALDFRPAFVLLDIGLPGMDGYQVASRLRGEESMRHARIIAVSGYGQESDRIRSREAGFDHHLVKPIDHAALITLISRSRPAPPRA